MGRSGFDDKVSQRFIHNIKARGCLINLIKGDVTILEDVKLAFRTSSRPVGGIVQGAMVVRVSTISRIGILANCRRAKYMGP